MRKILLVAATTAVGMASLSCSAPGPSADRSATGSAMVYERSAPVVRAPLSPPVGYASSPHLTNAPNQGPQTEAHGMWRASPRWAAVKGEGCIVVEHDQQARFADQAEAAKFRVENCSKEDADHLTPVQPEEHRGY